MIRVRCPKCANSLAIAEAQAGAVDSCPKCGQKFRVPTTAPKSSIPSQPAARQPKAAGTDEPVPPTAGKKQPDPRIAPAHRSPGVADQGFAVLPAPGRPEPDDRDEDEPDFDEEAPKPKKRKKKKKKPETSGLSVANVALVVVGLLVVMAATGIFFLIQRGAFKSAQPDPAQVLVELQQVGAQIERDQQSPDRPIIGLNLTGMEFDPRLLGKLVVFPQLRKLNLAQTKTSDINLEHLEDVTSLQTLSLSHTKVTGGGMQFLKKMVNMEDLNLNQTLVTDFGLRELKELTKLKRLNLDGTLASGEELKEAIPGLEIIK